MTEVTTEKPTSPEPETSMEEAPEQKTSPERNTFAEPEGTPRKPVPQQHGGHLFAELGSVYLEANDPHAVEAQSAYLKGTIRRRRGAGGDG